MFRKIYSAGVIAAKKERRIKKNVRKAVLAAVKLEITRWITEKRIAKANRRRFEEQCIFLNWW